MKFKVGTKVIIDAPLDTFEGRHNGKTAIVTDEQTIGNFIPLKQDYISGTWYIIDKWLKPYNQQKIKEKLGIK